MRDENGIITTVSLANIVEWFLNYDERVAVMRHPHVEELFQWKQQDSVQQGEQPAPFDSAEDRFAIGIFQALAENNNQSLLHLWISDVLQALQEAKQMNESIAEDYKFANEQGASAIEQAEKLPSNRERRFYLTSCWLEALCTAEVRVLGWVYQELYDVAYNPNGLCGGERKSLRGRNV
jgi:hypothetical protein